MHDRFTLNTLLEDDFIKSITCTGGLMESNIKGVRRVKTAQEPVCKTGGKFRNNQFMAEKN